MLTDRFSSIATDRKQSSSDYIDRDMEHNLMHNES